MLTLLIFKNLPHVKVWMTNLGKPFQMKSILWKQWQGGTFPGNRCAWRSSRQTWWKHRKTWSQDGEQVKSVIPVLVRDSPKENWLFAFSFATWMSCRTWGCYCSIVLDWLPVASTYPHGGWHWSSRAQICIISIQLWPLSSPRVPKGSTDQTVRTSAMQETINSGMTKTRQVWRTTTFFFCLARFYCFCPKTKIQLYL